MLRDKDNSSSETSNILEALTGEDFAFLSHKLRQPITAIRWSFELILLQLESEERIRELVQAGIDQSDRLAAILGNYARLLEPELPSEELKIFSLGELLREQVELVRGSSCKAEIQFSTVPRTEVRAFQERLRQSIVELLIDCSTRSTSLKIECRRGPGVVLAIVEDAGKADHREIEELFNPFSTPSQGESSANLVMAVIRKELRAAGGEARAERSESGGLRIVLEFPSMTEGDISKS